ncbi:hypothetical protein [Consotaella aegiceratis]|uniref:hypothetical protein n=1 Tax=Consotaella aegiceratis TaxID=3097961 RepID=UPI002F3F23B8
MTHRGHPIAMAAAIVAATASAAYGQATSLQGFDNDYPTTVIADYVFGCMKANGETRQSLDRCSCSIDVISTLLPYGAYEEAEAFLSLGQINGERGVLFRASEQSKTAIDKLRNAQVEAELRCF